jgi:molybdopterin-binding protein
MAHARNPSPRLRPLDGALMADSMTTLRVPWFLRSRPGAVMAEVVVDVDGQQVVAATTKESVERLGLAEGTQVTVIIKGTDEMICID